MLHCKIEVKKCRLNLIIINCVIININDKKCVYLLSVSLIIISSYIIIYKIPIFRENLKCIQVYHLFIQVRYYIYHSHSHGQWHCISYNI